LSSPRKYLAANIALIQVSGGPGGLAILLEFEETVLPEVAIDLGEAAELPLGTNQGVDENAFFGRGRLVVGSVLGDQAINIGGTLARDEHKGENRVSGFGMTERIL
jgi:hypothetical protein